jgi:16S rRNA processing protein RimM
LRGATFEVERNRVPDAPQGSYYYFELVGCACRDVEKGNLGSVTGVLEDGGGLLLRVQDGDREILVPFVEDFITDIDVSKGMIELELPKGLIETCTSV